MGMVQDPITKKWYDDGSDEFDNLFLVTTGTPPSLLRLHYR